MNNIYFTRWPDNLSDVAVTGTDIRYLEDGKVYFSNETFSPGKVLCTWRSKTNYIEQGIKPTLPLLESGQKYTLTAQLKSDNGMSVQLQIIFYDINQEKIDGIILKGLSDKFTYPDDAVSYEISLLNLNNKWLKFDYLKINNVKDKRSVTAHLGKHGSFIFTKPAINGVVGKRLGITFSRGPSTITEVPELIDKSVLGGIIHVYTDGNNLKKLLNEIKNKFEFKNLSVLEHQKNCFYHLTDSEIKQIKYFLSKNN